LELRTISVPPHTMKAYGGTDIFPSLLNLGNRREWSASCSCSFTCRE